MKYITCAALLMLAACGPNAPREKQQEAAIPVASKFKEEGDSVNILHHLADLRMDDTQEGYQPPNYLASRETQLYADSSLTQVDTLLPALFPLYVMNEGGFPYYEDAVKMKLASGRMGFVKTMDIGLANEWQAGGESWLAVAALDKKWEDENYWLTALNLYKAGQLQQTHRFWASIQPRPFQINAVKGRELPAPLYGVFSFSESCIVPSQVHLFCYNGKTFDYVTDTFDAENGAESDDQGYQYIKGKRMVAIQKSWLVNSDGPHTEEGEYLQDTTYISTRNVYEVRGTRYVLVDSMPAVTEIKWPEVKQ